MPTQAPTASIRLSSDLTAIFALDPGSLDAPTILIRFWLISGTSILNNSIKKSGLTLDNMSGGPFKSSLMSFRKALIRSCGRMASLAIDSLLGRNASALFPTST